MLLTLALMMISSISIAKYRPLPLTLHRLFDYKSTIHGNVRGTATNVYTRYTINTDRRNPILMSVPSMYVISKGKRREFIGEIYSRMLFKDIDEYDAYRQVIVGTVPRHRRMMPTVIAYFTPDLYGITMIQDRILSPFHRKNHQVYKYKITTETDSTDRVMFTPKITNTQLVKGFAIVDRRTGRICSAEMNGEYDMIHFKLQLEMGTKGVESLLPLRCDLSGKFGFIGNRLRFSYHNVYGLPTFLPDSIRDNHDRHLMDQLRPDSLSEEERIIYHHYDSLETERELRRLADTTHVEVKKKHNFVKDVLWDMIGDNLVNRVKGSFGGKDKGTFRINPILNPLYFGYSGRKGFVYKFDVRAGYNFTPNRDISMRFKSGYSFKQRQFYFRLPMEFNYNKRRHAFFRVEVGNGNRISNSSILDAIYQEYESQHIPIDSTYISNLGLEDFRDTYVKMENNYDISDYWSILGGFVYHRRSAVNKAGFHELQRSHKYHTSAPALQLQFRPRGWDGPYFTLNWERSFKGLFNSDYEYEKYEFDASLIRQFHRLRSLSLRFGAGAYTLKNSKSYFLDYSNFRDENIRGGWKDDWSGNFQVLRSRYFNSSNYYIRGNATFESPLMILSRLPLVGKYLEMERIYSSALFTQNLKPYVEVGYGFTNRIFSLGVFVGTRNGKFDGIGCEFGIELFDKW